MIDDYEAVEARIETALDIIKNAFEDAIDNADSSELEDEVRRGVSELMACCDIYNGKI